ncbi:hypothetical protein SLEP1_g12825 [Rubroshorea leprosula]|uniref:Uncharacterized protein n=1 Tax=Rubroshorea leprosula TaxID=152421 RepID=A0AAV5IP45_9ROSI|nr:hypothetical protein SLEP1_g12825 [Rubroshorea leprosula]
MGFGRNEASGDSGGSTSMGLQRLPSAAQPEIMRAAEKDDQHATFVYDAYHDAFWHKCKSCSGLSE